MIHKFNQVSSCRSKQGRHSAKCGNRIFKIIKQHHEAELLNLADVLHPQRLQDIKAGLKSS